MQRLKENSEDLLCRILITSRNEPDIRSQLSAFGPHQKNCDLYEHEVLIADTVSDVVSFSQSLVKTALHNKSNADQDEIAKQLAEKCEGMFLWVELQGGQLRGGKSKKKLLKMVDQMPKELVSVYKKSWESILGNPIREDKSRALKIIRWAMFASRPLTVSEITEALTIPDDDEDEESLLDNLPDTFDHEYLSEELVDCCASLIEARATSKADRLESWTIHLKHFSVRQFLLSESAYEALSDVPYPFAIDQSVSNNHLAAICLQYIRRDPHSRPSTLSILKQSFYDYAARSWFQHLSPQGTTYWKVSQTINHFFQTAGDRWVSWSHYFDLRWQWEQGFITKETSEHSPNPLHYAAWLGLNDTFNYLLQDFMHLLNTPGGSSGTPLQAACYAGHLNLVMQLIKMGADVNFSAGCYGSALGAAVNGRRLEICKYLVDNDADIDHVHEAGTPIFMASKHGYDEVVKYLCEKTADLAIRDNWGWTPLHVACNNGHRGIVEILADRTTDLSWQNLEGQTPLHLACLQGHDEVVQYLLDHNVDYTIVDNQEYNALHYACTCEQPKVVKLLLHQQMDISATSKSEQTYLQCASRKGCLETVRLLVDRGADVMAEEFQGRTALHTACGAGKIEIVQLLFDRGARDTAASSQWTSLHFASYFGHLDIVQLLMERGPSLLAPDADPQIPLDSMPSNGGSETGQLSFDKQAESLTRSGTVRTALLLACANGNLGVVQLLLSQEADVFALDYEERTALHLACREGNVDIVRLLIDRGAHISRPDVYALTPLHHACSNGHLNTVRLLIGRGADPSARDVLARTPLHVACAFGHLKTVEVLLGSRADPLLTTGRGETCLHFACRGVVPEMITLLAKHGLDCQAVDQYGHSCIDWASDYQPCLDALRDAFPGLDSAERSISHPTLNASINSMVKDLLRKEPGSDLGQLGHGLMFIGDEVNACTAFEQSMDLNSDDQIRHPAICDRCESGNITDMDRFVCKSCVDFDLCQNCIDAFRYDGRDWRCKNHSFLRVPRPGFSLHAKTETQVWLLDLQKQYPGDST